MNRGVRLLARIERVIKKKHSALLMLKGRNLLRLVEPRDIWWLTVDGKVLEVYSRVPRRHRGFEVSAFVEVARVEMVL